MILRPGPTVRSNTCPGRKPTGPAACSTGSARPTRPMPPTRSCWPARGRREIFTKCIFRGAGPVSAISRFTAGTARTSAGREIADLLLPGVPSEAAEALRALAGRMEGVRLVSSSGSCVDLCGAGVSKGAALREYCRREGFSLAGTPRAGGRGKRPFHAGNLRASLRAGGLGDLGQAAGRARDRALRAGPARARAQGPLPGGVKNAPPSRSFRGGGVRVLKLSAVPVFAVEGAVLHRLGEVGRADAFGSRRDRRSCAPP